MFAGLSKAQNMCDVTFISTHQLKWIKICVLMKNLPNNMSTVFVSVDSRSARLQLQLLQSYIFLRFGRVAGTVGVAVELYNITNSKLALG